MLTRTGCGCDKVSVYFLRQRCQPLSWRRWQTEISTLRVVSAASRSLHSRMSASATPPQSTCAVCPACSLFCSVRRVHPWCCAAWFFQEKRSSKGSFKFNLWPFFIYNQTPIKADKTPIRRFGLFASALFSQEIKKPISFL